MTEPTPEAISAAERILAGVKRANHAVHAMFRRLSAERGISVRHAFILRHLARSNEPLTLNEVAEKLDLPKSTTSVDIDRLVKAGYVLRGQDPRCRRRIMIQLSPEGRMLVAEGPATVTAKIAAGLASSSDEDVRDIENGLIKLNKMLDRIVGEDGHPHPACG
ncbi:MAG: MarR family winged helix-turn-helix transcriptional regulator [Firmicutes bacterium]|jgi:DNA-binding MarR family transcriptional regulator|nr:MarR family winged helix-turn-helix transcriptional regulator [Bacillota bacterium]